jgi:hypothetical protein
MRALQNSLSRVLLETANFEQMKIKNRSLPGRFFIVVTAATVNSGLADLSRRAAHLHSIHRCNGSPECSA